MVLVDAPEAILVVTLVLQDTLVTLVLKVVETTALPFPPFPPFYLDLDLEAAPFLPPPPLEGVSA